MNVITRLKNVFLLCAIALCCTLTVPAYAEKTTLDFTWDIGEHVNQGEFIRLDGDASYIKDGDDVWMIYSAYLGNHVTEHMRYKGTSLDNLKRQESGVFDESFNRPYGDDVYWICGAWADPETGIWYAVVHDEFYYVNPSHVRNIQLGISYDKGLTWSFGGEIITSDDPMLNKSAPGRYISFGSADQKLFVDEANGYFYIYYMNGWIDRVNGGMSWNIYKTVSVARSPISAKMAPGSWTKWYNGSWSQPGLGGHDSPLFAPPSTAAFVSYNTYLNRYIAIGMKKESSEGFISTCTDMEKQDWTEPVKFLNQDEMHWYQWVVDPETFSRDVIGQSFRFYGSSSETKDPTYRVITLDKEPRKVEVFKPDYSFFTDPVFDYNMEYDPIPLDVRREDFIFGMDDWKRCGSVKCEIEQDGTMLSVQGGGRVFDSAAPMLKNGHFVFTAMPMSGKKFGAVFRYASSDSFAAIRYDNGVFTWSNAAGQSGTLFKRRLNNQRCYRFDIDFTDHWLTVKIDGQEQYRGEIPEMPVAAGLEGFESFEDAETLFDNVAYYDGVIVEIDGLATGFDVQPVIAEDHVMVPLRRIFEQFGVKLSWDEETETVTGTKENLEIQLTVGSAEAVIDGVVDTLDVPIMKKDERILVPVRLIEEALGAGVEWDEPTQTVKIASNGGLAVPRRVTDPMPPEIIENTDPGKVMDILSNLDKVWKQSGSIAVRTVKGQDQEIENRVFRTENTEASLEYKVEADIENILVKGYHNGEKVAPEHYYWYVSPDGDNWENVKFRQENIAEDKPNSPGMFSSDLILDQKITPGNRYFKLVIPVGDNNWFNQVAMVAINDPELPRGNTELKLFENGNIASGSLKDTMEDLSQTYQSVGNWTFQEDNRSALGVSFRAVKERAAAQELIYRLDTSIENFNIRAYHKTTDGLSGYKFYVSDDGETWTKINFKQENTEEDPTASNMYFSDLKPLKAIPAGHHYLKIEAAARPENTDNQIAQVLINL